MLYLPLSICTINIFGIFVDSSLCFYFSEEICPKFSHLISKLYFKQNNSSIISELEPFEGQFSISV